MVPKLPYFENRGDFRSLCKVTQFVSYNDSKMTLGINDFSAVPIKIHFIRYPFHSPLKLNQHAYLPKQPTHIPQPITNICRLSLTTGYLVVVVDVVQQVGDMILALASI